MIELTQFRFIFGDLPLRAGEPRRRGSMLQVRHAQVVADNGGHLLILQDEDGKVQYGPWKDAPSA